MREADDIAYLDTLIDEVVKDYDAHVNRIDLTGGSNGDISQSPGQVDTSGTVITSVDAATLGGASTEFALDSAGVHGGPGAGSRRAGTMIAWNWDAWESRRV